jgi:hypothetical protein
MYLSVLNIQNYIQYRNFQLRKDVGNPAALNIDCCMEKKGDTCTRSTSLLGGKPLHETTARLVWVFLVWI